MSADCDHRWLVLPWYSICLDCYETNVDQVVGQVGSISPEDYQAVIDRDKSRPWTEISVTSPLFMEFMRLPFCPDCGSMVLEETMQRQDKSRPTSFTCLGCERRWWVYDENER